MKLMKYLCICGLFLLLVLIVSCIGPQIAPSISSVPSETQQEGSKESEEIETKTDELTTKGEEILSTNSSTASWEDFTQAVETAAEAQAQGLDELAEQLLNWAKDALSSMSNKIISIDPCDLEMEDLIKAVEFAAEALKLGLDTLADNLLNLARNGIKNVAARETNNSITEKERYELAQTAQELGLDELAQDILDGKKISSECAYVVHAEVFEQVGGEVGTRVIIDAYTYNEDVHKGWKGFGTLVVTAFDKSEKAEGSFNFDLPSDGSSVMIASGPCELWAKIVGEETIIFTYIIVADDGTRTPLEFPPGKIMRGAPSLP